MQTKVIEFFGLPGAGKTYLAWDVVREMRKQGCVVDARGLTIANQGSIKRIMWKLVLVLGCLFFNIKCIRPVFSLSHVYKVDSVVRKYKLIFNWLYVLSLIRGSSKRNSYIVMEQGVAQALWSTLFSGKAKKRDVEVSQKLGQLLEFAQIGSLNIIHVQASEELIKFRLETRKRGKSPLDTDRKALWQRASQTLQRTKKVLNKLEKRTRNIQILEFTNEQKGVDEKKVQDLLEYISEPQSESKKRQCCQRQNSKR